MDVLWDAIGEAVGGPAHAVLTRVSRAVREHFVDRAVMELEEPLDVAAVLERSGLEARSLAPLATIRTHAWEGDGEPLAEDLLQGHLALPWEGGTVEVVQVTWHQRFCEFQRTFLIGDDDASLGRFAVFALELANDVRGEVLVYSAGWERSPALHAAIQRSSLEDLVLPDGMLEGMVRDLRAFLGARETYASLGLPWRRGALLVGPPGNGKTHCIRGLLRELALPVIYVKSFEQGYQEAPEAGIRAVFRRARLIAPCVVVLEDLDALVTEKSKSFFLNELDGLTDNTGVIVLASTNWPERLDPALRDRPSRFDRRYTFALPGRAERIRWLERWDGRSTHADVRLGEVARRTVAAETAGFSYAFLQELLVAGMLGWVAAGGEGSLLPHVREALGVLRDQVGTEGPPED